MISESRESPASEVLDLPPPITQGPELPETETPYKKPTSLSLGVWPSSVVGVKVALPFSRVIVRQSSKFYDEALLDGGGGGRLASGNRPQMIERSTTMTTTSSGTSCTESLTTNTTSSTQILTTMVPPLTSSLSSHDVDMWIGGSVAVFCLFMVPCIFILLHCHGHFAKARIALLRCVRTKMRNRRKVVPVGQNDIPCEIKVDGGDHKARFYMPQSPEAARVGEQAQTSDKRMLKAAFGIVPESPDAKDDEISNLSPRLNSNDLSRLDDFDDTFEDVVTSQSSLARCPPTPSSTILSPLEDPPSPSMNELPKLHVEDDTMHVLLGVPERSGSPSLYTPCETPPREPMIAEPISAQSCATSSSTQDRLWQSATDTRAEERDEVLINVETREEYSRRITDSPVEW